MYRLTIEEIAYTRDKHKALQERVQDMLEYSTEEERARWLNEDYVCPNGDHSWIDKDEAIFDNSFEQYNWLSECRFCDTYKITYDYWDEEESQRKWDEMDEANIPHKYPVQHPEDYITEEELLNLTDICLRMGWVENHVRKVPNKDEVIEFNNSANYLDETTDIKLSTKLKEETRVNPS